MFSFLLTELSKEDQKKFDLLYQKNFTAMLRAARKILLREDLAEDAVQNAFFIVFRNLPKIYSLTCSEQSGFLIYIVKGVSFDIFRKEKKYSQIEDLDDWQNTLPTSRQSDPAGYAMDMLVNMDQLDRLTRNLSEIERFLLFGSTQYGFSYRELGAMSNISEKNVSVTISRVRKKLREQARREEGGNGN